MDQKKLIDLWVVVYDGVDWTGVDIEETWGYYPEHSSALFALKAARHRPASNHNPRIVHFVRASEEKE